MAIISKLLFHLLFLCYFLSLHLGFDFLRSSTEIPWNLTDFLMILIENLGRKLPLVLDDLRVFGVLLLILQSLIVLLRPLEDLCLTILRRFALGRFGRAEFGILKKESETNFDWFLEVFVSLQNVGSTRIPLKVFYSEMSGKK